MPEAAPIDNLLDILELIDRIDRQTGDLTREGFLEDADVQDATAYRLLAIGEAVKDLDEDLRTRHPHIPWRRSSACGISLHTNTSPVRAR
jgi:uncharacterized protein with HEPN domain